jgi:hypothetical protein
VLSATTVDPRARRAQEREPHEEYRFRRLDAMLQQTARDLEYFPDAVPDDSTDRQMHCGLIRVIH